MDESVDRIDGTRCPLCAGDNACGAARGAATCWCYAHRIPEDVLAAVPENQRDRVCVCERCASGGRTPAEAPDAS